jgi:hypothetical protein
MLFTRPPRVVFGALAKNIPFPFPREAVRLSCCSLVPRRIHPEDVRTATPQTTHPTRSLLDRRILFSPHAHAGHEVPIQNRDSFVPLSRHSNADFRFNASHFCERGRSHPARKTARACLEIELVTPRASRPECARPGRCNVLTPGRMRFLPTPPRTLPFITRIGLVAEPNILFRFPIRSRERSRIIQSPLHASPCSARDGRTPAG